MNFLSKRKIILAKSRIDAPPPKWKKKMEKDIMESSPHYSDEQLYATINKIWYHNMDSKSRGKVRKEY